MPANDELRMTNHSMRLSLDEVSLFLDLDGTLAPFASYPDGVAPETERNAILRDLAVRLDGRVAIISGRSIEDIDRIVEGAVVSVAGCHGLERRDARLDRRNAPPHRGLSQARSELHAFADKFPGILIEEKPLSVAFHFRNNPAFETTATVFAEDLARRTGLTLQTGAMVVEFLTPGMDKGKALRAFMIEPPFAGSIPLFVGDDLTDENGFRAVNALGGMGVLVGPPRATLARYRLDSVDEVLAWLEAGLQTQVFSLEVPIEPTYSRI